MRRVLIGIAIAIAGIIVLIILAVSLINVNRFRPTIQAELQQKLNRPVTLGTLHLRLFPLSVRADGLTIGQSAAFPSPHPFATAQQVYASVGLFSLIGGHPDIKSLVLQDPQIELIRNASGVWNFSDLESGGSQQTATAPPPKPAEKPASSQQASSQPSSGGGSPVTLGKLQINNGQVAVTDEHAKTPRTVYNHIDLTLTNFAPDKQFNLYLAAHLPGPGKELLSLNGKGGPLHGGDTPIAGQLSIQQVSLAGLNTITQRPLPPKTDALMSGTANVATNNGTIDCKGNLTLADATVQGKKLGYPIDAQYDLGLNQKSDQLHIASATIRAGGAAVSLSGDVNFGLTPANLNLHLSTNDASVPDLMNVVSLLGGSSSANDQIKGSISANLAIRGTETAPNVQGQLSSNTLQAQDIVLNNLHANINMDNGVARLSPITAGIFGGQENGNITVDLKTAHPQFSVQSKLSGVDTNALLSAVSSVKDTLYGSLNADANLSFALDASANLARTLNGTLGFDVVNGHLKNVNILSELSKIGKFLNSAPAQTTSGTTLQKLSGTFNIRNGVADTNNLVAALPEGSLSANGSLNLVNEGIDMHATAVLSSGISKDVGGTGIGAFMNTALANNKGELVLPVIVTGTMAHPVFAPDVQSIAKMKLSHLLPTADNPSKMTGGLLGSVLGAALGQSGQQNKNQPKNPIGSILNQLTKKPH